MKTPDEMWPKWYEKNRKSELARHAIYKRANREQLKKKTKEYKSKNIDKIRARNKIYKLKGRDKALARQKYRYATEPTYRIARLMRCALWRNVQLGGVKNGKSAAYFGTSYGGLRTWIEYLFKPGMTWDNHGTDWEIDHIIPLSWFDLNKDGDAKAAWFYANLRPAWKLENRKKGNRSININAA
jgi:hypothetical protein